MATDYEFLHFCGYGGFCEQRRKSIEDSFGLFARMLCGAHAAQRCPWKRRGRVPVLGQVHDLPVVAAGADPRIKINEYYLAAAGEYDVMPYLGVNELLLAVGYAREYSRLGVPWALVLRRWDAKGTIYSLYKRRPRGGGAGILKPPKTFRPVNGHRTEAAALPRFSKHRVCP